MSTTRPDHRPDLISARRLNFYGHFRLGAVQKALVKKRRGPVTNVTPLTIAPTSAASNMPWLQRVAQLTPWHRADGMREQAKRLFHSLPFGAKQP